MKKILRPLFFVLPFAAVALLSSSTMASRQEHSPDDAKKKMTMEKIQVHGGQGYISKKFCFETLFKKNEIRIYLYNANAEPILTVGVGGRVVLKPAKSDDPTKNLVLKAWQSQDKSVREFLYAEEDFSKVMKDSFTAQITITNLKEEGAREIVFDIPFLGLTREVSYWCPKCEKKFVDPGDCAKCGGTLERKIVADASGAGRPN